MEAPIRFKFIKMDLTQFATFSDGYTPNDEDIEIFNRFQFAYNFEDHLVLCKTMIEIFKDKHLLLKADLDNIFKIDAESASAFEHETEAVLPPELLAQFASLAYGSLRGVLYIKTVGTPFNNFVLPPNDVSSVFKGPQIFSRDVQLG